MAAGRTPLVAAQRRNGSAGQVLVIFALSIVVLLVAAGLSFDVGRFYSEKRFLQNAADAAALAAANALIRGENATTADAEARDVLTRNFVGSPSGVTPSLPPATPVYEDGHAGDSSYLIDGILITNTDVRVAVRNPVGYTFGRVAGLGSQSIGGRALVKWSGNMLPIAVRQFVNAPGPNNGATNPCPDNQNQFVDFFATANTSCLGNETDRALRTDPSPGNAFDPVTPGSDPTNHGPVVAILGQGAQPANGVDFRGFIALDVRDFRGLGWPHIYYNGVTDSTNPNTLKAMEAGWITAGGYPGPGFPPATSPPDPNDQVAIMSGNSTGIAIDEVNRRFAPSDEVLVAVYPGNVMAIPDFAISPPGTVGLPTSGTVANAASFKVSKNQEFSGTVTLSTEPDTNDPDNPLVVSPTTITSSPPITYTPNPVTPAQGSGTTVQMQNITTTNATPGIYALWIKGQANPSLTTKYEPFAIKVGTVTRDFTMTSDVQSQTVTTAGDAVTFNLKFKNAQSQPFDNPVSLSVDTPWPSGIEAIAFGSTSVTPSGGSGTTTTLTIDTATTISPGSYRFVVRATGMNGDTPSSKVTHLLVLTVVVGTGVGSASDQYIDIVGFAVMRIASADSNTVSAYAITPVIPDMNDSRLRRGQVAKLVPWT